MSSMNKANLGVALVTGASTGIGQATAKTLRNAGFRVFGTSRHAAAERADGVTMLSCDVTDDASVAKLVDEVLAKAGRIDLLVNNAGIGLLGGAEESSIAQAQALFDVNVFGVLRVTGAVLPAMRRQASGRIVNLSSVLGLIPAPYLALYAATKHAIEGYSESLDHELRAFGIRVVLVEPAYTRTSFEDNLARPDQLLDIYDSARAGMNVILRKAMATGDAPDVVATTILEAATASRPRRRYAAGKTARQVSFLRASSPSPHSTRASESRTDCRSDGNTTSYFARSGASIRGRGGALPHRRTSVEDRNPAKAFRTRSAHPEFFLGEPERHAADV
jgi:NAD(P)-dependent dehydrogenase (short-subunit alcohol dehydrogenase family)